MRRLGIGCALLGALASCASLAVRPGDSSLERLGKYVVRVPLSLCTLSVSEYRIQAVESGRGFERYDAEQQGKIEDARARAADAETYGEYREWIEYAERLEMQLEQLRAARAAGLEPEGEPVPEPPDTGCVSRREGDRVEVDCR